MLACMPLFLMKVVEAILKQFTPQRLSRQDDLAIRKPLL
jgi:hypothetical protein